MNVDRILSGIFLRKNGQELLDFIDNKLVQKKKKEDPYDICFLYQHYIESLQINNIHENKYITTDDLMKHIDTKYKGMNKEERYLIYMDSIRIFFHNIAHNKSTKVFDHNVSRTFKNKEFSVPLNKEMRSRKKTSDICTVISETTDVKSSFTYLVSP